MLDAIEIDPGRAVAAVIWLHGLGADGYDFEPLAAGLELPFGVRFVFPHAPVRPVTINGGVRMRAWFDLLTLDATGQEDEAGIRASAAQIHELIERERARGLDPRRIALAGFSQGGAIALHAALREAHPLAGVLALSAYLPLPHTVCAERPAADLGVPIWMAHGSDDPVIPLSRAVLSRDFLSSLGYAVNWRTYAMGHAVCAEEVRDLNEWLIPRLQGAPSGDRRFSPAR